MSTSSKESSPTCSSSEKAEPAEPLRCCSLASWSSMSSSSSSSSSSLPASRISSSEASKNLSRSRSAIAYYTYNIIWLTFFLVLPQPLSRRSFIQQYLVAIDMELVLGIRDILIRSDSHPGILLFWRFWCARSAATSLSLFCHDCDVGCGVAYVVVASVAESFFR